ncbi:DUF6458 family protein [Nocardioides sp. CFH 31398]|uniref:DUF6458 family protein n=1 Tax=Nocardioides sp. CFH 31398 TaxID=2919579 RepID=UPI001F06E60F|nr:DUF6458 family protein [Nocardioides sp. CFH 31398]MCH1864944.1 DUF6458 family protein [Nocardioides sp. CFH 31398]
MGIGLGIVLLVLGLILVTDAVQLPQAIENAINGQALGWIFIIVSVIAIGLSLAMNRQRNKTTHVEERRDYR